MVVKPVWATAELDMSRTNLLKADHILQVRNNLGLFGLL